MSLDVYLMGPIREEPCQCNRCWNEHTATVSDELYTRNITHNLNKMASEAGLYAALWRPDENGLTHASDLITPLEEGLARLVSDREKYEAFNPENGWGDYEGLVRFVRSYLAACREYPDATVRVSR